MKKKVFKIIGIVLASVFGFTGAVFGVLALMGKFKTPDVYPDVLVFQQNEIVVVDEYIPANKYSKEDLYSFTLTGITNNEEYADVGVNKTTCYIWFADEADKSNLNVGASLITLCDAEGNALKKITDINDKNYNRYKVDCNSPIYFKINSLLDEAGNEISSIANLDGKVLLSARHENEMVSTTNPLTIWIDRTINSVSLQDGTNYAKTNGTKNAVGLDNYIQSVTVGSGVKKNFEYIVNPEKARNPISVQEKGKTFELYIVDPSKTDYVKLTPDKFIEDDSVPNDLSDYVYNVVKYDAENEKFYIETDLTDVAHNFKIAVFPTFEAKQKYELDASNEGDSNWEKLENMLVTSLEVNVVNANVTSIELDTHSVGLGLYSENDYVSLNGSSGLNDVKNNNLGLVMYKGTESTDLRYDEAKFADYQFTDISDLTTLQFINQENDKDIKFFNELFSSAELFNSACELSYVYLSENEVIVNKITASGTSYYCRNGVLVKNTDTQNYRILKSGTYLDFYVYAEDKYTPITSKLNEETQVRTYGTYDGDVCTDQRFIVNRKINAKGHTSWNIVATKEIGANEDIRLGVLVINSDGTFSVENFFKTAITVVEVRSLTYSIDPNAHTLNIYHNEGVMCDSMEFDDIVYQLVGSYNAVVFAVPTTENCGVEVLSKDVNGDGTTEKLTFTIGEDPDKKSYYIVGWMDGETYKNEVRITDTDKNEPTILKLMQFKNGYEKTAEDIIQSLIEVTTETEIAVDSMVNTVFETVTINPKQNLDTTQVEVEYSDWKDTKVDVYENTTDHTIKISSTNANMLEKVFKFYDLGTGVEGSSWNDYIKAGDYRVVITNVGFVPKDEEPVANAYIQITYSVTNELISEKGINIIFSGVGSYKDGSGTEQSVVLELGPIFVNKSTPTTIAYVSEGNKIPLVMSNQTEALASSTQLQISVSETKYTQTLSLTNGTTTIEHKNITFNTQITGDEGEKGFLDADGFKVPFTNITYLSLNNDIFTIGENGQNLTAVSAGTGVLQITIGGVNAYLKVVVASDGNYQFKVNNSVVTPNNTTPAYYKHIYNGSAFTLDVFASLEYYTYETNLLASTTGVKITNADCNYYGNGLIEVSETDGVILFKTSADEETLKIYKDGSPEKWTFVRTTNQYVPITVTFDVITKVGTITIQLDISSDISAVFNQDFWQTNTIYAGTTVLVYEKQDTNTFTTNALLHIKSTNDPTIYLGDKKDNVTIKQEDSFETCGIINLNVYVGNSRITSFAFNVVPNVVITNKNKEFNSNTNDDLTSYYEFKSFNSEDTFVYGKTNGGTNGNYLDHNSYYYYAYEDTKLTNVALNPTETFTDLANLSVECDVKDDLDNNLVAYNSTNKKLGVGWLKEVNSDRNCNIKFKYNGEEIKNGKFTVNVKNQYTASLVAGVEENGLTTLTEYVLTNIVIVDGLTSAELKEVYCKAITENNLFSNSKVLIPAIAQPITAEMEFNFELGGKELIYKTNVKINPYKPTNIANSNPAYSEEEYDLLGKIFNISSVSDEVASIIVDGVYADSDRTQQLTEVVTGSFGVGYIKGVNNPRCVVTLNAFEGDSKIVYVGYTITYIGVEGSYSFTEELTIQNKQAITLNYPEQDEKFGFKDIAFKFKEDNAKDGMYLSCSNTASVGNVYAISSKNDGVYTKNYAERILISDKPTVISFKDDNIKYINRVNIIDRNTSVVGNPYVVPIAYETQTDFDNFFNNIEINPDKPWEVTLPEVTAGTHGYIIFKVLTESGNYVYYYIYVFCEGEANVKADSNLVVNAISGSLPSNLVGTSGSLITEGEFDDKFGQAYNSSKISFYVTDIKELTENGYVSTSNNNLTGIKYKLLDYSDLITPLENISKYTTITISVMYSDGGLRTYGIGTITLIVQPETNEGTQTPSDLANFDLVDTNKINGEYKATITNNTTSVSCPFDGDFEIVKIEQSGEIVKDAGSGNLTLSRVEDADYTFTVFYKKDKDEDELIVKVTYTYSKTTYIGNTTITGTNLGEFVQPVGKNAYFVTEFNLSEYLYNSAFNYVGPITLGGISLDLNNLTDTDKTKINENVSYKIDNKEIILVFNLSASEYNAVLNLKMGTGNNVPTSTLTFPIKAGVSVKTDNSSGKGMSASEGFRLITEDFTPTGTTKYYEQPIGSKLMVDETKINNNVYKYSIGGLTVYTSADANIEVKFNEVNYLTNGSQILTTGVTSEESAALNFVHLAEEKDLDMTINILRTNPYIQTSDTSVDLNKTYYKYENGYYIAQSGLSNLSGTYYEYVKPTDETTYTTQTLYITVQKTYEDLIAQYVTIGADHENVVSGTEIPNIYNYLFNTTISTIKSKATDEGAITNNLRIGLVVGYNADKNPILAESVTFGTTSSVGMGFAMENNPNKITFKFKNTTITGKLDFSKFYENVDSNTSETLYISNNAGVEDVGYKFQIVPGDASTDAGKKLTDTITYSKDFGYVGDNYISFTEWLKEDDTEKELTIGTLTDGINDKSFYLTNIDLKNGTDTGSTDSYADESVKLDDADDGLTKIYIISSDSTDNPSYQLQLIYYGETGLLTCKLITKSALSNGDQIKFTISLFGTTNYIVENFAIVFTEQSVTAIVGDTVDANTLINLFDDKKLLLNGENKSSTEVTNITLELNTTLPVTDDKHYSYYTINGKETKVESETTNLFTYNETAKRLTLDQVGDTAKVNLVFDVKYNNIYISQVVYSFNVLRNLVIVANGESVKDRSSLETDFHLTKEKDVKTDSNGNFPLTYSINSTLTVSDDKNDDNQFRTLIINLYELSTGEAKGMENITLTLDSDHHNAVKISDNGSTKTITFNKDLTETIEILVTVDSALLNGNGSYSIKWFINVHGIIDLDGLADNSTVRLKHAGTTAFNSSDSVNIVNSTKSSETAIQMTRNTTFTNSNNQPEVTVNIEGKFVESNLTNDDLSNYDIFNTTFTDADGTLNEQEFTMAKDSSTLTINLPYLESGKTYIVVYKLTFTYLSLGEDYKESLYVGYIVQNNVAITENIFKEGTGSSEKTYYGGKVDMDDTNRLIADNPATTDTTETGAYLDLFYYSEIWKNGEDEYILTYAGDYTEIWSDNQSSESKYKLKYTAITKTYSVTKEDGTEGGYYNATDGKVYTAANGTACTKISTIYDYIVTKKDGTEDGYYNATDGKVYTSEGGMLCTKESSNTYYPSTTTYSVFNSSFSNIVAYKDFITKALTGYVAIKDSKNNQVYYFKVESLGAGRFGIDLMNGYTDATFETALTDKAFVKNELIGDLVVYIDNAPVVTLTAYNEQEQKGFMLCTENKLTYTAGDNKENIHTISSMFMDSEIGSIATGYDLNKIKDIRVLGIVNKDATTATIGWVAKNGTALTGTNPSIIKYVYNNGTPNNTSDDTEFDSIATIKVETGISDETNTADIDESVAIYTLHPVIYSGGNTDGKIYKLEDTFYVLKTSTSEAKIAVRNYSATSSIVNTAFRIAFNPDESGNVSLNTANAFRLYSMNSNVLKYTTTFDEVKDNDTPDISYTEISQPDTYAVDGEIKIAASYLIAYKAEDLSRMNYRAEYKVTIGGINVKVYVQFVLPSNIKVINYSGSGDLVVEVKDLNLTLSDGVAIQNVVSTNSTYADGKITIDKNKISAIPSSAQQEELTLTLTNGGQITYYLVIFPATYTINYSGSGDLVVEVKDLNLTQNNSAVDVSKISTVTLDAETTDIYNAETKAITIQSDKLTGTYPLQKKLTITLNDDSVITHYLVIKTST